MTVSEHKPDCCLDLDHKGDCKRWMRLPPNPTFPKFKELHVQDDWCPKAGCRPASRCEIDAFLGGSEPSRGAQRAARKVWAIGYVGEPPEPAPADEVEILQAAEEIDRESGHVVLLEALRHALPILIDAIAFVDCKAVVAEVRAAIQQAERT